MERYSLLLRDLVSTLAPKASNRLGPQVSYTAVATSDAIFGLDGTKIGTVPLEDDGIGSSSRSNSSGSSNSISDTTYAGSQLPLSEVYSRVMETCTAMLQHKGTGTSTVISMLTLLLHETHHYAYRSNNPLDAALNILEESMQRASAALSLMPPMSGTSTEELQTQSSRKEYTQQYCHINNNDMIKNASSQQPCGDITSSSGGSSIPLPAGATATAIAPATTVAAAITIKKGEVSANDFGEIDVDTTDWFFDITHIDSNTVLASTSKAESEVKTEISIEDERGELDGSGDDLTDWFFKDTYNNDHIITTTSRALTPPVLSPSDENSLSSNSLPATTPVSAPQHGWSISLADFEDDTEAEEENDVKSNAYIHSCSSTLNTKTSTSKDNIHSARSIERILLRGLQHGFAEELGVGRTGFNTGLFTNGGRSGSTNSNSDTNFDNNFDNYSTFSDQNSTVSVPMQLASQVALHIWPDLLEEYLQAITSSQATTTTTTTTSPSRFLSSHSPHCENKRPLSKDKRNTEAYLESIHIICLGFTASQRTGVFQDSVIFTSSASAFSAAKRAQQSRLSAEHQQQGHEGAVIFFRVAVVKSYASVYGGGGGGGGAAASSIDREFGIGTSENAANVDRNTTNIYTSAESYIASLRQRELGISSSQGVAGTIRNTHTFLKRILLDAKIDLVICDQSLIDDGSVMKDLLASCNIALLSMNNKELNSAADLCGAEIIDSLYDITDEEVIGSKAVVLSFVCEVGGSQSKTQNDIMHDTKEGGGGGNASSSAFVSAAVEEQESAAAAAAIAASGAVAGDDGHDVVLCMKAAVVTAAAAAVNDNNNDEYTSKQEKIKPTTATATATTTTTTTIDTTTSRPRAVSVLLCSYCPAKARVLLDRFWRCFHRLRAIAEGATIISGGGLPELVCVMLLEEARKVLTTAISSTSNRTNYVHSKSTATSAAVRLADSMTAAPAAVIGGGDDGDGPCSDKSGHFDEENETDKLAYVAYILEFIIGFTRVLRSYIATVMLNNGMSMSEACLHIDAAENSLKSSFQRWQSENPLCNTINSSSDVVSSATSLTAYLTSLSSECKLKLLRPIQLVSVVGNYSTASASTSTSTSAASFSSSFSSFSSSSATTTTTTNSTNIEKAPVAAVAAEVVPILDIGEIKVDSLLTATSLLRELLFVGMVV